MSALGLDVGTYTLKAIVGKPGSKVKVERTAEVFNANSVAIPTDEGVQEKLTVQLDQFFNDHSLPRTDVRLSLPESVASTKVIGIPPLSDAELASAVGWQAEQHIPIPLEELSLEYKVLSRPPRGDKSQQMQVLLVGVRKAIVGKYIDMFMNIGIEPTVLETQSLSILRAMQFTAEDPATMVVTIGASTMDMFVVTGGQPAFVFSHMMGGTTLTKSLESSVGLDSKQAEQYKRTYGLNETQFEGKIAAALQPTVQTMVSEIQKAIQFHAHQQPTKPVQKILLNGGSAQLPGLVQFVTQQIGLEVLVAAPFASAEGEIPQVNQQAFSVCMGLVMREWVQ